MSGTQHHLAATQPGWWARKSKGRKALWIVLALPIAVIVVVAAVALVAAMSGEGLGSLFGGGSGNDRVGSRKSGETTRVIKDHVSDLIRRSDGHSAQSRRDQRLHRFQSPIQKDSIGRSGR
jgi:hypothetical protein